MKITNTNDESITTISALLIGESGAGKTTSLRTLPTKATVIACCERSVLPLRGLGYTVFRLEGWSDLADLHEMFLKPDAIADETTRKLVQDCKVLVLDSLSDVDHLCARHIVEVDRRLLTAERTKGTKDERETPKGMYAEQMTIEDWGLFGTRMLNMISAFAHLPVHFVATCVEGQKDDKLNSRILRTVNIGGKTTPANCPAYFDLVLNMLPMQDENGHPVRRWQTFNDGVRMCKDSSGKLAPFEECNWTKLFKKIRGTGAQKDAS